MTTPIQNFFFGREAELNELARATTTARITTVCGPAGVGKTALIRHFLRDATALVVDVTDAATDEPIETVIARAMKLALAPEATEEDRRLAIAATLAETGQLIVLDNAEHLIDEVRDLVTSTALQDPVRFLLTSRERLDTEDEHVVQLAPFATDSADGEPPEALRYFRRRASTLGSAFELADDELETAQRLVRHLDGLALAMELAAHRLNLLRPAQLLTRVARSTDVLSTPWSDADRSRSLHDAIAESWDGSTQQERTAMRQISLLSGPFDVEVAEALLGDGALELLQRLRDRSLLVREPDGRLRMLLAIREHARGCQQPDDLDSLVRLGRFFSSEHPRLVAASDRLVPRGDLDDLRRYRPHVRTVVDASLDPPIEDPAALVSCAVLLAEAVILEGTMESRLDLLRRVSDAVDESAALDLRIGRMQREMARLEEAAWTLEDVVAATSATDAVRFAAWLELGMTRLFQGDLQGSRDALDAAALLADDSDLHQGRLALYGAGIDFQLGRFDEARSAFELAIRHARRARDVQTETRARQNLGVVLTDQHHLDRARKCLQGAIDSHAAHGDRLREAWARNSLGVVELRAHREDAGIHCFERAHALFEQVGHRVGSASTLANLAMIANDFERYEDAHRYAVDALDRCSAEEDDYIRGMSHLCVAYSSWMLGHKDHAGRLYADRQEEVEAVNHIQLIVSWLAAHGSYLASIGDPDAEQMFARGEALLTDDAAHEMYHEMFRISRVHVDLHALRKARASGDAEASARMAFAVLDTLHDCRPDRSEPLRYIVRLVQHEAPDDVRALIEAVVQPDAAEHLLVSRELRAFRAPAGEWSSLARSPSLWRLFEALLDARLSAAGTEVDNEALMEAVWPDELLTADSASNRLHVSLSKLRTAGLKPLLVRGDDGYRFDEAVQVVQA